MLAKGKMNCKTARMIDIVDFLEKLGYSPTKINEREAWFLSPLRGNESIPSFNVNRQKQLWYDFGLGEGGDIISLGCKIFNCSVTDFLAIIQRQRFSFSQPFHFESKQRKITVVSISELGDPTLINYIESRGIDIGIAKKFCRQIEYTVGNAHYSSIGFENIIGGWEIRDKSFKGATVKAISVINHSSSSVCVFEGFFDLLSFVQLNIDSFVNYDLLSLNSLSLIKKSVTLLERYQNIILFLDNDERGREVAYSLSQSFGAKVDDRSNMYSSFKDLNEYLTTKKGKGGGYSEIVAM